MSDNTSSQKFKWFSIIAKYLIIMIFTGVIAYKLIVTPFQLTIDFLALLSIALALFSVGLSATFYFKATETSNAFYDNTFKYTKEIAELLVRIESGFGERLKHLDESYSRIQDRFLTNGNTEESKSIQEELEKQEKEFQEKLRERDAMFEELAKKAKLEGDKKVEFLSLLRQKELELQKAQQEIDTLKTTKTKVVNLDFLPEWQFGFRKSLAEFTRFYVLPKFDLPRDERKISSTTIVNKWHEVRHELPQGFLEDMYKIGFIDSMSSYSLTKSGINFINSVRNGQIEY